MVKKPPTCRESWAKAPGRNRFAVVFLGFSLAVLAAGVLSIFI